MENNSLHKLGIDIGSTTVKIALLDADDNILFSIMSVILQISRRHLSPLSERPTTRQATFQFVL